MKTFLSVLGVVCALVLMVVPSVAVAFDHECPRKHIQWQLACDNVPCGACPATEHHLATVPAPKGEVEADGLFLDEFNRIIQEEDAKLERAEATQGFSLQRSLDWSEIPADGYGVHMSLFVSGSDTPLTGMCLPELPVVKTEYSNMFDLTYPEEWWE